MTTPSIEFLTAAQLRERRKQLLQRIDMTIDELLDGEYERTLDMKGYLALEELRGIEFLLEEE